MMRQRSRSLVTVVGRRQREDVGSEGNFCGVATVTELQPVVLDHVIHEAARLAIVSALSECECSRISAPPT
jgi:hypothetical protein